jgi:hypothetical protein
MKHLLGHIGKREVTFDVFKYKSDDDEIIIKINGNKQDLKRKTRLKLMNFSWIHTEGDIGYFATWTNKEQFGKVLTYLEHKGFKPIKNFNEVIAYLI